MPTPTKGRSPLENFLRLRFFVFVAIFTLRGYKKFETFLAEGSPLLDMHHSKFRAELTHKKGTPMSHKTVPSVAADAEREAQLLFPEAGCYMKCSFGVLLGWIWGLAIA